MPLSSQIIVSRVKWFRERAARDHAQEEKEILEEEFRRTQVSFERMSEVWKDLATRAANDVGAAAYASKQASMYCELARDCSGAFQKVLSVLGEE